MKYATSATENKVGGFTCFYVVPVTFSNHEPEQECIQICIPYLIGQMCHLCY